jgi:hypothetical protein
VLLAVVTVYRVFALALSPGWALLAVALVALVWLANLFLEALESLE